MRTVQKYNLTIEEDVNVFGLPFGGKILSIGVENNKPVIYVLAQEDKTGIKEGNIGLVQIVKTDQPIDEHELYDMNYLRTLSFNGIAYHFFYLERK